MESRDNNKTDALLDVEVVPKPVTVGFYYSGCCLFLGF